MQGKKRGVNEDALLEVRKITGKDNHKQPTSSRSNNLEIWLSKKKAFDEQSASVN